MQTHIHIRTCNLFSYSVSFWSILKAQREVYGGQLTTKSRVWARAKFETQREGSPVFYGVLAH